MKNRGLLTGLVVLASLPIVGATAARANYVIDRVTTIAADSPSPNAAINNRGQVAFLAALRSNFFFGNGIYRSDGPGSALTPIAGVDYTGPSEFGSPGALFTNGVSIDDRGVVAFTAGNGFAVGTGDGDGIRRIMQRNSPPSFDWSMGMPSINNAGVVAAIGMNLDGNPGPDGGAILAGDGGPVSVLLESRSAHPVFFLPLFHAPINDVGSVAFNWFNLNGFANGAYRLDAGQLVTLFETNAIATLINVNALNDRGLAAWSVFSGDRFSLMVGDGIVSRTILEGTTATNVPAISLNNSGDVAYMYEDALWTLRGDQLTRVIGFGDAFGGSTVQQVYFGPNGLNDSGQIAFGIDLANGERGIYLGSAVVPEPPSLLALATGLVGLAGLSRWRRR